MRAVLDPNVLISALLSRGGRPAEILRAWLDGAFELVISPALLTELERALGYPKIERRITSEDGHAFVELLRRSATLVDDPPAGSAPVSSPDPGDDYLLELAVHTRAVLVSGDKDLLGLDAALPIYAPAAFIQTFRRP